MAFFASAALAIGPAAAFGAPGCKGLSSTGIAFGAYDPFSTTPLDSVGSVSYNCPPPVTPPQITISAGGSGTFFPRGMTNPSDPILLQYNLFVDASRTTVWGDGTGGTAAPTAANGNGTLQVYGRVPPLQDVAVGTFTDTVIVTFNF